MIPGFTRNVLCDPGFFIFAPYLLRSLKSCKDSRDHCVHLYICLVLSTVLYTLWGCKTMLVCLCFDPESIKLSVKLLRKTSIFIAWEENISLSI